MCNQVKENHMVDQRASLSQIQQLAHPFKLSPTASSATLSAEFEGQDEEDSLQSKKRGGVDLSKAKAKKSKKVVDEKLKPKELLSESQKRLNHVQSEQKRRANIKEGFAFLERLTPSLYNQPPISQGPGNTGGGHSKQAVLKGAAEYIVELKDQLKQLNQQIALLKGSRVF
jgi:hypothetical protein